MYLQPDGCQTVSRKQLNRYGFIRYADDMLVTAETREDIEAIVPIIEAWLKQRGLELNQEKVHSCLADIRAWLKANASVKPEAVIHKLNPLLRGWGNYYKHGVSKQTFHYVDYQIWQALWRWVCRRHPRKSKYWIANKYFMPPNGARWTFNTTVETRQGNKKTITLFKLMNIPVERHIKVKGTASPDDPQLQAYWTKRQTRYGKTYWVQSSKLRYVAQNQDWRCPVCGEHLFNGAELNTHHKIPVKEGGSDKMENLVLSQVHFDGIIDG